MMDFPDTHVQLIKPGDFHLLSKLFNENNIQDITNTFDPFPLTVESAHWIACQPHQDKYYLAISGGIMVGFSMLRGWEEGYSVPSFGMFVDYGHQGRGFGNAILDLTIQEAKNLNCRQIRLSVFSNNPIALKMYLSRGFQQMRRELIEHHGIRVEKIIMVKDLM